MTRLPVRFIGPLAILAICCSAPTVAAQTTEADGWVVLPVDEYRALRERTGPQPAVPATLASTITRIDYELRTDGDVIAGRALLTVDVLRDGWTRVHLPPDLIVRRAMLDGRPAPLVPSPAPHVLLDRAGRFVLDLDVVLPLERNAGTDAITLPASPAPVARATLLLPRGDVDLTASGGLVAAREDEADGTRWTVFGEPHRALVIGWKRRIEDRRAGAPLRLRAHITQVVGLAEDVSQLAASVRIDVVQGMLEEASLELPAGVVVNRVDGSLVGGWDLADGQLRVQLLEPVSTSAAFVILSEVASPREGTMAVPIVRLSAAERETGGVAVEIVGSGEVTSRAARGLDAADPSELGDIVAGRESPSMLAFRHRPIGGGEPRSLTVDVVRYTPQAVLVANVEQARYRMLAAEDGRLLVEATYAVRNNQRSFLKVTLPAGAIVWSASVGGRPTRPGGADPGALLLPLEKGRAGEEAPVVRASVVYLQPIPGWPDRGRLQLALPAIDLPISTAGVRLHHSPRFRVKTEPGAFRESVDPGLVAETVRRAPSSSAVAPSREGSPTGFDRLIGQFRSESGVRAVSGTLPVPVVFPDLGPSLFVASELIAEGASPTIEIAVRRAR